MIVYQYILDKNNNIQTIQVWGENEKPKFKNNPIPNDEILQGNIHDKFGNPLYSIIDNKIIKNNIVLSTEQIILNKINKKNINDIVRILINAIDNPKDEEFLNLKSEIIE